MNLLFRLAATSALLILPAVPGWGAADPQLLALLPPDAKIIAGLDAAQIKAAPLGQFLLTRFGGQHAEDLNRLKILTGFDPRTDLLQIVAAGSGDKNDGLVIARGSFEPTRLQALAKSAGVYRGVMLLATASQGNAPVAAFLDATTAVAGSRAHVQAAIDRWIDGAGVPGALSAEAARLSGTADAWIACNDLSSLTQQARGKGDPQAHMAQNIAAALVRITGGVTFGAQDVAAKGEITARSADDAQAIADLMKLIVGLAPPASPIVSMPLHFAAEGETVTVSLSIPEADVEQMLLQHIVSKP